MTVGEGEWEIMRLRGGLILKVLKAMTLGELLQLSRATLSIGV